jgi:hypothetical protein
MATIPATVQFWTVCSPDMNHIWVESRPATRQCHKVWNAETIDRGGKPLLHGLELVRSPLLATFLFVGTKV